VLLRPGAATLLMALPVLGLRAMFGQRLNHSWLALGIVVLVAVAAFAVSALAVGAVKKSDLPGFLRRRMK